MISAQQQPRDANSSAVNPTINRLYDRLDFLEKTRNQLAEIVTRVEGPQPPSPATPNSGGASPARPNDGRPAHVVGGLGYLETRLNSVNNDMDELLQRLESALG